MPEPPRSDNNAIKWIAIALFGGCVILSIVIAIVGVQIANQNVSKSAHPVRMTKLDGTWGRYLFEDIGVQIELPEGLRTVGGIK